MKKTIESTPEKCRHAEINATLSSCCGVLGEITLTDSAVIILFAGMLGASDMFSMLTTSVLPLFNGLLVIPMAWLAMRFSSRKLIIWASLFSAVAYFLTLSSPFFGKYSVAVLIGTIVLFALCTAAFIAGWFPTLDTFLQGERRTFFFSRMRFSHQLTSVVFLFLVGLIIGKNTPIWQLQIVLLISASIYVGRLFFITRIPAFTTHTKDLFGFKDGLMAAIGNKPLTGFSVYLFVMNLTTYGTIPLMMIYLKNYLNAPDNVVVMISAVTLFGMLMGYFGVNHIVKRFGLKSTLPAFHLVYILVNFALVFIHSGNRTSYLLIAGLLLLYSFILAASTIIYSSEMMALATPGNKTMAMALCGAFTYGGSGFSRLITSLILGSGLLASEWHLGAIKISQYQTLFLIYAIAVLFAAIGLVLVPQIFSISDETNNPKLTHNGT